MALHVAFALGTGTGVLMLDGLALGTGEGAALDGAALTAVTLGTGVGVLLPDAAWAGRDA